MHDTHLTFSANYARNPQFFIDINDPDTYDNVSACPVIISLGQKQAKRKSENAIGFKVYKCSDPNLTQLTETYIKRNCSVSQIKLKC